MKIFIASRRRHYQIKRCLNKKLCTCFLPIFTGRTSSCWLHVGNPGLHVRYFRVPSKTLFTWRGGPRSSGVGFFCFVSLIAWKQKKPTPLDRGPPLHINRPLVSLIDLEGTLKFARRNLGHAWHNICRNRLQNELVFRVWFTLQPNPCWKVKRVLYYVQTTIRITTIYRQWANDKVRKDTNTSYEWLKKLFNRRCCQWSKNKGVKFSLIIEKASSRLKGWL